MLTDGGSEAKSIEQINEAMYPMSAGFNAQVDKEMTRLSGQVHKDNLEKWYSLVRGQLLFPAWSEQDFERIKSQTIEGLLQNRKTAQGLAGRAIGAVLYGQEHPLSCQRSRTVGQVSAE